MSATQTAQGRILAPTRAPTKAITCTAAVALMLATTRWGSYIGVNPLFLTDLLILLAVVDRLLARTRYPAEPVQPGFRGTTPLLVLVFLAYVVVRMLFSGSYVFTVTWLRDGAPYLYGVLALVSAHSVARASDRAKALTMRWIWWALILHLAWVCGVGLVGSTTAFATPRPFFGVGVFNARPDIDAAVLGITAGLLLRRALLGRRRGWAILGLLAAGFGATSLTSRAGFIAIGVACVIAFAYSYAASGSVSMRRVGMALAIPVALFAVITVLPSTTAGSRLVATIDPSRATSAAQESAVGTTDARRKTWSGVLSWTTSDSTRTLVGAGMGIDFLEASGTLKYLEGTDYENVRSPHDYFIGSFARLGLIGLGLILAVLLALIRRAVVFRKRICDDELLTFAVLSVFSIVSVASFGVVLEAPFGAVPFWWCAGLLFALAPLASNAAEARDG